MPVSPIVFKVTDAGRDAAAYAFNNLPGGKLSLSTIKVGLAKYSTVGNEIALQNPLPNTFSIGGGGVQAGSGQIRFTPILASTTRIEAFEIGLFTDTGILFAIAATPSNSPLFVIETDIEAIFSMNVALANVDPDSIQIVVDVNAPLAVVMMGQHLSAAHPHPPYKRTLDNTERLKIADGVDNDEAVSFGQLSAEAVIRAGVDAALAGQIAQEVLDRQNGDLVILNQINNVVFCGSNHIVISDTGNTFTIPANKTIRVILIGGGGGSGTGGSGGGGYGGAGQNAGDSLIYPTGNSSAFFIKAKGGLGGGEAYGGNGSSYAIGNSPDGQEVDINNLYDVVVLSYQNGLKGNYDANSSPIDHPTVKKLGLTTSGQGKAGTSDGYYAIGGGGSGGAFVECLIINKNNTPLDLTIDCGVGGAGGVGLNLDGTVINGQNGNNGVCVVIHE